MAIIKKFRIKSFKERKPIIKLENISLSFKNRSVLENISFNLNQGQILGLLGPNGVGKSTIFNIITGLLKPNLGSIIINGKNVIDYSIAARSKKFKIGYVPQNIYLSDDTIAANIAFGVDPKNIDQKIVESVSKIANLHDFVVNELPKKYQTTIGERGVRLSGGQRQRVAIARALYHNPKVLILDEATSALDNHTEQVVMEAVKNLSKDLTIILIAHRLNTVKNCDIIFKLDNGKILEQGSFDKLIKK